MSRYGEWKTLLGVLSVAVLTVATLPKEAVAVPPAGSPPPTDAEVQALTQRIDERIAARWAALGVQPVPPADDAEFIRRLYLDLAGRIPPLIEVQDFLDDDRPNKRRLKVDQLLEGDTYARHFANVWRTLLLGAGGDAARYVDMRFESWLQQRLAANTGYDQIVREILTAVPQDGSTASPSAFLQVNELKPENLAASTSRVFLGVKLECAQCHAHPFAHWSRTQFWELAAFFADIGIPAAEKGRPSIQVPGTDRVVRARFLDGTKPPDQAGANPRMLLAGWVTSADNPFFARAAVNQLWTYFFGTSLVETGDEPDEPNPASHPELLDELARSFAGHRFDLKLLIRAIIASRAYQLTSSLTHPSQKDPHRYARMAVRSLSSDQLFDSLAEATEFREPAGGGSRYFGSEARSVRGLFLRKFGHQESRTEAHTSILQALFLMNGQLVAEATTLERSKVLTTVAETVYPKTPRRIEAIYLVLLRRPPRSEELAHLVPYLDTAQRLETLYLVALARKPRPEESARLVPYVLKGGVGGDPNKALADVFWSLLNSAEFFLNH